MGKVAAGVGQHHFIRSYLPALIAVLLSCALALVAAGIVMDRHLAQLALGLAQRGSPGHSVALELDLSVGQFALDSVLAAQTGDERVMAEAFERLDSAASAYDGWSRAARLRGVGAIRPAVAAFEERVAVATASSGVADGPIAPLRPAVLSRGRTISGEHLDAAELESALADVTTALRRNRHAAAQDATAMLAGVAAWQHRRRWVERSVLALLAAGCLGLMIAARRREQRVCDDEKSVVRDLEQSNADLEAFAGRVAHDLRNPLLPILSGSQVIERSTEDSGVRRAAERIERSARRIASMIDMLLDFSRMANPNLSAITEVGPIVEDVVDGFRDRARALGVELQVSCPERLYARAESIVVASPLQNLIENALKYGRSPGGDAVVDVRAFWRAGMVIIEVEDRGPGISAADAESLFRVFERGRAGGEGVGLGLATARRLAEARGGSIGLRTGRYGGALFQIRLPASYAPDHGERRQALSSQQV